MAQTEKTYEACVSDTDHEQTMTDDLTALVRRAQQNDSEAFGQLYALTYAKQYGFARHYLCDEFYAQDAAQEVYIRAFGNIGKLKEPKCFFAWLMRINFHVCQDMAARHRKCFILADDKLEEAPDERIFSNPERLLLQKIRERELWEVLNRLPVKERNALLLRYLSQMSLKEVARKLGCSVSSVTRYLNRGRRAVRQTLV